MTTMQKAVYRYEGTVRQFIIDDKGSVLIAAFGLPPLSHQDDPILAIKSSMLLQKRLKKKLHISCSIGITTGKVFCGAVGSTERREYAVVGDLVNLSARLMAAAGNGNILTDESTYYQSRSNVSFETLEKIRVKGKADPISIFKPKSLGRSNTTDVNVNKSVFVSRSYEIDSTIVKIH